MTRPHPPNPASVVPGVGDSWWFDRSRADSPAWKGGPGAGLLLPRWQRAGGSGWDLVSVRAQPARGAWDPRRTSHRISCEALWILACKPWRRLGMSAPSMATNAAGASAWGWKVADRSTMCKQRVSEIVAAYAWSIDSASISHGAHGSVGSRPSRKSCTRLTGYIFGPVIPPLKILSREQPRRLRR